MAVGDKIDFIKPKIIYDKRPLLSIVIAYYNGESTIRKLLDSILHQKGMENRIEVILSNDCSPHTQPLVDVIHDYEDLISLKVVNTDYNFAPGNTRERGASIAEGKWLAFADQDDFYIDDSLGPIMDIIEEANEQYLAIADFYEVEKDNPDKIIRDLRATMNWNHAKFYNLDNLWKRYNIHFKKDLLTHEDIYISSCVNCTMKNIGAKPLFINKHCYKWTANPGTISRQRYDGHMFIEMFFGDYLESTGEVYLEKAKANALDWNFALGNCTQILMFCYHYLESFKFHMGPEKYIHQNEDIARDFLIRVKEFFKVDNQRLYNISAYSDAALYESTAKGASIGTGPYIPSLTWRQWLDHMHKDLSTNTNIQAKLREKNMEILDYGNSKTQEGTQRLELTNLKEDTVETKEEDTPGSNNIEE